VREPGRCISSRLATGGDASSSDAEGGSMRQHRHKHFGSLVTRLIQKQNLTREEAHEAFSTLLANETSDLQQGAFLAALCAKGETSGEVAGAWKAIYDLDTNKTEGLADLPLLDNCGTGMDTFKTFNISTAASLVAASVGIPMARHGARALSGVCGAVDLAEALGVDAECPIAVVEGSVRNAGIGLFNGMSPQVHPMALGRILSQIHFGSTLNISASLANPALPRRAVRGVYAVSALVPVAEVMKEIGYRRALVLHGKIDGCEQGMDEASVCGATCMRELREDGSFHDSTLRPEALGLAHHAAEDLAPIPNLEENAVDFLKILAGRGTAARTDAVILNAALVFKASGREEDLQKAVPAAREILQSGRAIRTLKHWVEAQNRTPTEGLARLEALAQKAGVSLS
jgi:anthranilate phosphoribosyltransferase